MVAEDVFVKRMEQRIDDVAWYSESGKGFYYLNKNTGEIGNVDNAVKWIKDGESVEQKEVYRFE